MESTGEGYVLNRRWQNLHLMSETGDNSSKTTSQKADSSRGLLESVEYARAAKVLSHAGASQLFLHQAGKYATLVDSTEQQGGLNNFAEGALALLIGKRNESKIWTSSLDVKKINELKCVKDFISESQAALSSEIPKDKENLPLPVDFNSSSGLHLAIDPQKEPVLPGDLNTRPVTHPINTNNSSIRHDPLINSAGLKSGKAPLFRSDVQNTDQGITEERNKTGHDAFSSLNGRTSWNRTVNTSTSGRSLFSKLESVNNSGHGQLYSSELNNGRSEQTKRPFQAIDSPSESEDDINPAHGFFRTAKEQLSIDNQKKFGKNKGGGGNINTATYGSNKRSLGTRRALNSRFVPPVMNKEEADDGGTLVGKTGPNKGSSSGTTEGENEITDERLKNIEPKMVELIMNEIMDLGPAVTWDDIAGLAFAKKTIQEIVVWPMMRPDIFTGLRGPPKGLLLFGPPGTGKTLIGKCIASQSKSTFFSISASSLTSKWVGEGEKMVRALFAVARVHQPAVIFIDEIDSLLSQRSDGEHEASRRIKTEFLVQLDGATTGEEDRILVVGATNRPQEIDEAARRRFVKRLYIPLPEGAARRQIIINLMMQQKHELSESDINHICQNSTGYSGADMANLCREAALGPIRSISFADIESITAEQVRPIVKSDFENALKQVRASVSEKDLAVYLDWNKAYGSWSI